MKENFIKLWLLQDIDRKLNILNDKLKEIPQRVQDLNKKLAGKQQEFESSKQGLTEHKKQYKLAEVELRAAEEKLATYSAQLYSAKTNEQYKAFLKEIENQKRLKSEIEDKMIVLMEKMDELETKLKVMEKEVTKEQAETQAKLNALEAERKELESAITEQEKQRQELLQSLPPDLLRRYERIRKSKGGVAIATTEQGRCNGCLSPIPPQRLLEIEREDKLYLCETCGRILLPRKAKQEEKTN